MEVKRFLELLDHYFFVTLKDCDWSSVEELKRLYQEAKANAAIQLLQEQKR